VQEKLFEEQKQETGIIGVFFGFFKKLFGG
jgi:hypothetical protein